MTDTLAQRVAAAVSRRGGEGRKCSNSGGCPDPGHKSVDCPGCVAFKPKPLAENVAWLKAWMLATHERECVLLEILTATPASKESMRFTYNLENASGLAKFTTSMMLRLTDDRLAECILEAEGMVEK